ncbi:MAG: Multimeric flavodoxin WrbA-like protein [Parcubacteria group bacterium GW2011_GWA2_51_10]|nr:MAG: Multimeric flavodoxin WrbA-like protein [Parcubacteria group bacterium GW2011_GWA2_51_10]
MPIRALILLGTLKKNEPSNTEVLSEFLLEKLRAKNVSCELIKLVNCKILPGTYSDMGQGDEWPSILEKILAAEIIIFATPIWWNSPSSEIQRVIERLDEIHDEILEGKKSKMAGKVGGVVITGDPDGAQSVIGTVGNFFNFIGMVLPPYATLSVLSALQRKDVETSREKLLELYRKDYAQAADTMVEQLMLHAGRAV